MADTATPQVLLKGQSAAPEGPVDVLSMYVMHHAFRRDLAAFRAAADRTPVHDRSRWQALRTRWQMFATALHHHHAAEDAGLWPLLLDRVAAGGNPEDREVLQAMQAEHARIDPVLDECADGFARLAEDNSSSARREKATFEAGAS